MNNYRTYLRRLIKNAHKWQKLRINDIEQFENFDSIKAKWYQFSFCQVILILISLLINILNTNYFDTNYFELVTSIFSIFIGLLLALLIIVFDKFGDIKPKSDGIVDIGNYKKTKRYFAQFNSITMYSILLAIIVIILLISSYIYKPLKQEISIIDFFYYIKNTNIDNLNYKHLITIPMVFLYRCVITYFILDFFYLLIYAIISIYSYFNKRYMES